MKKKYCIYMILINFTFARTSIQSGMDLLKRGVDEIKFLNFSNSFVGGVAWCLEKEFLELCIGGFRPRVR